MGYKLECNKCGHERLITEDWLKSLKIKFSSRSSGHDVKDFSKIMPRVYCSKCLTKGARISWTDTSEQKERNLSEYWRSSQSTGTRFPKAIPGFTLINPTSDQKSQENLSTPKWDKKTCRSCNGTGANGNCYNCDGTGWEEAKF